MHEVWTHPTHRKPQQSDGNKPVICSNESKIKLILLSTVLLVTNTSLSFYLCLIFDYILT